MIKTWLVALLLLAAPAQALKATVDAEAALLWLMGETSGCSASHIGNGVVLTAAHCIPGAIDESASPKTATLWVDREHDVALLYRRGLNRPAVTLACEEIPIGTEIEALGNPYGLAAVHTYGQVASRPMAIPGRAISWQAGQLITAVLERGMSGGMVLDAHGRQVGLIVGGVGAIGVMVPGKTVCGLMG
jgi:S1-C subfamily serine protease